MCESNKHPDYLLLVNAENKVPEDFVETVELVPAENIAGDQFFVEKKAYASKNTGRQNKKGVTEQSVTPFMMQI